MAHESTNELLTQIRRHGCPVNWTMQELLFAIHAETYGTVPTLWIEKYREIQTTNTPLDNDITDTQTKPAQGVLVRNFSTAYVVKVTLNTTDVDPRLTANPEDLINVDSEATWPSFLVRPGEWEKVEFKSPCITAVHFVAVYDPITTAGDSDDYASTMAPVAAPDLPLTEVIPIKWQAWSV